MNIEAKWAAVTSTGWLQGYRAEKNEEACGGVAVVVVLGATGVRCCCCHRLLNAPLCPSSFRKERRFGLRTALILPSSFLYLSFSLLIATRQSRSIIPVATYPEEETVCFLLFS